MKTKNSRYLPLILIVFLLKFFSPFGSLPISAQVKKTAGNKTTSKTNKKNPVVNTRTLSSKSVKDLNSQPRHALVIGNSSYPSIPLSNPVNDASSIAKSLRLLNFKVTEKRDLTLSQMRQAVEDFSRQIPSGAVGLFFFAGHGIQVSGKNFLLPIDFKDVKNEKELIATQLDLDSIVAQISKRSDLTIVILDACRNNAVKLALSFETEQGFSAPEKNSGGIYIAFSTSPGSKAYDGYDGNSPYSKALSKNLLLNPARLEDVFIKTRVDVRNATLNFPESEQIPWENGSLNTLFYFTADKLNNRVAAPVTVSRIRTNLTNPKLPLGIKSLSNFSFAVPRIDETGSRSGLDNKTSRYFIENLSSVALEMVEIPGGSFQMGSDFKEVEKAYEDALKSNDKADRNVITAEMPKHLVNVPGFFMSKYEITQGQWKSVMSSLPPDIPQEFLGDDKPVVNVTWKDAKKFCDKLAEISKRNYRLPTEAEWEYAARAGTDTPFAFGENINSNYVNFFAWVPFGEGEKGEFRDRTVSVGEIKTSNSFGLVNMHGNVWEWCEDYWHWDYNGAPNDGSVWRVPAKKQADDADDPALYRVIRGGSYESIGNNCRSAHRRARPAIDEYRYLDLGFRVVVSN